MYTFVLTMKSEIGILVMSKNYGNIIIVIENENKKYALLIVI